MVLTLPASPSYSSGRWRVISNAARFVSPLSRVGQSVQRPGTFWACFMELPPLDEAEAGEWAPILAQMAGGRASAYVAPPYRNNLGSVGTPLINGAAQVGSNLAIDGLPNGKVFPAGRWLCYDTSTFRMLHMTTAEVTANGSGQATFPVFPAIRKSPADNAAVNFVNPTCEMKLEEADIDVLNLSDPVTYGASFALVEDVRE